MKKIFLYLLFIIVFPSGILAQPVTVGTSSLDYATLVDAFEAVNAGDLQGDIVIQVIDNTLEYTTAVLYESGHNGTSNYTSVTIYPTVTGLTITGDAGVIDGPLIDLDGATNVTFDGRLNATGSTVDLTIVNTNTGTSASTIRFLNSAQNNTVKYCNIKGSETDPNGGIIFFSSSTGGTGNDGNTISNNNISSDAAGRAINAIYSSGTSGMENSGNIITNNNIFDFLKHGTASNGIYLSLNTTSFTISGNSFYETTLFDPTASVSYTAININNTSGTGFSITGNYIGGQSASCGGSAFTKTKGLTPFYNNVFYAMYLNVGTGTASDIQNNTIKNVNWTNSAAAAWTGIYIAGGDLNIGTSTGNTIGASTGTGSVIVTGGATNTNVYGINIVNGGTVDCRNNIIGSITAANSDNTRATNFIGISRTTTSGTATISNNTIGSTSTANSIYASSGCTGTYNQTVSGIYNSGIGTIIMNGNTIANINNGTTNTNETSRRGYINGIYSTAGTVTISNNIIHDLTIANGNNSSAQNASVCGISLIGTTYSKTITGNAIYNLSNTYVSFLGNVIGIYFLGNTTSNDVKGNFIHSLSATGASSIAASLHGIKIAGGTTTYSDNIISLDGSTLTNLYGINETGAAGNNNNIYYNTLYIGGSVGSGTNKSYALYSALTTNTRNFRNNILYNARSTTGGSNFHYAIYIVSAGGTITTNFNDYYFSGTGGTLGYLGGSNYATLAAWQTATGQDVSSFEANPGLSNPGGTSAADYLASAASLVAVTGTGILNDYASTTRSVTYPSMGAWEYTVAPSAWTWTGSTDTDWSTASNWNYNTVPSSTGDAIIADVTNDPIVNTDPSTPAECQNLTINANGILTIAAGKALKVNGTITNNAGNTGLIIKSDANGNDGMLINDSPSVPATVELYLSGGLNGASRIYHYFVPPVQTMTIGVNLPYPTVNEAKANLGITNFTGDLLAYSEVAAGANKDNGWQFFDGWNSTIGFASLTSDRGYNINFSADDIITFTGNLNGSAHNFGPLSFTNQGWNLVGNPYPCNFDLNGISLLTGSGDDVDNTVYFNRDGGYAYWNVITGGTTGYSDIMPPMQGFFVHVTASGKTLNLPVTSKTGSAALPLRSKGALTETREKKAKNITVGKIKLVLSRESLGDETIICLIDDATPGFDSDYDAYKLFATLSSAPSLYSELSSIKFAINTVQKPITGQTIIPLTVEIKNAGEHRITITEFENLYDTKVVLVHGTSETLLSDEASYTFTSGTGVFRDFQLVLGEEDITTGVENKAETEFKAWYRDGFIYLNSPFESASGHGRIMIYNMQGKSVFDNNQIYIVQDENIQIPVKLQKGFYILNVIVNNKSVKTKIVVY